MVSEASKHELVLGLSPLGMTTSAMTLTLQGVVTHSKGQVHQVLQGDVRAATSVALDRCKAVVRAGGGHSEMLFLAHAFDTVLAKLSAGAANNTFCGHKQ